MVGMEDALAEKELALRGIQRNYESLSSLMQFKQAEIQQLQTEVEVLTAEKAGLSVKLEDALQRSSRYEQRHLEICKGMDEQQALQTALSTANFKANVADERAKTFQEKLAQSERWNKELLKDLKMAREEAQGKQREIDKLANQQKCSNSRENDFLRQKEALESEVHARQDSMKQLQRELHEAQKTLSVCAPKWCRDKKLWGALRSVKRSS